MFKNYYIDITYGTYNIINSKEKNRKYHLSADFKNKGLLFDFCDKEPTREEIIKFVEECLVEYDSYRSGRISKKKFKVRDLKYTVKWEYSIADATVLEYADKLSPIEFMTLMHEAASCLMSANEDEYDDIDYESTSNTMFDE